MSQEELTKDLADKAIAFCDATISTQYGAENAFWASVQRLKDALLEAMSEAQ
jgi:hypothetical protein